MNRPWLHGIGLVKSPTRTAFTLSTCLLFIISMSADCQTVVCSRRMHARSCDLLAVPIENELQRLGTPSGWKWIILDAQDWRRAGRMFHAEGQTETAFTVRDLKSVFLNADYLQMLHPKLPTGTLAHELGHILCRCSSEMVANKIASDLIAGYAFQYSTADRNKGQPDLGGSVARQGERDKP